MSNDIYISFGAQTGELESAFALARASTQSLSKDVNSLAREMVKTGATADSELGAKLNAAAARMSEAKSRMGELSSELRAHSAAATEAGLSIEGLSEHLRGLVEAGLAAAGIELGVSAFKEWVGSITEGAEKFQRLAAQLGASTTEVQAFGAMAQMTGTDANTMATQLERLQLALAKSSSASSPARAGLHALGIEAEQFRRLSIPQQFEELSEAVSKFADSSSKTAAVQALGRGFVELLPLLDKGKEGLDEINAAIERSGVVMANSTVAGFAETREHLNELGLAFTGFSQRLFSVLQPAIDAAVKGLTSLVENANPAALQSAVQGISTALVDMAQSIAEFAIKARADWEALVSFITGSVSGITYAINTVNAGINTLSTFAQKAGEIAGMGAAGLPISGGSGAVPTLDPTGKLLDQAIALNKVGAAANSARAKISSFYETSAKSDAALGGVSYSGPSAASLPQVPEMQIGKGGGGGRKGGKGAAATEAKDTFGDEVDNAKQAAKTIEDTENNLVKQHKIGWQEWAAATTDALEQEATAIKAAADKALASTALSSEQKIQILQKEKDALAEIACQEADAQAKAAEVSMRTWENLAKEVEGAVNGQLKGLVAGTESFSTAMKKIAEDALMDMVKLAEQIAKDILLGQSLSAAFESEGLGGLLSGLTGLLGGAGAGAAGGGLFADAELGGAILGAPLGFASGAWELPHTQLAMVHAGEMIVPSQGGIADQFRRQLSGGGGLGGGDTHIHNNSHTHNYKIDGSRSPQATAKAIAEYWDRNPSVRPRY